MEGIACQDLREAYGRVRALEGALFAVDSGRVLALSGSNDACGRSRSCFAPGDLISVPD